MKKLLGAASAAAILIAAGSAFAQAPSAIPGAPTPAPGFGIQGAPAAEANAVSVDTIVAALGNAEAEIAKLPSLPESATIQIVELDAYLDGADAAVLNPALTAAEGQATALQDALKSNATILAQLDSANVELTDVVGFGVDGANVLVFVRPSTSGADAPAAGAAPAAPAP